MTPDEIRRLYSIRHTLPAFQRQMIERAYSDLEGTVGVSWDTPDIDAADSAAVEIQADPSLTVPLTEPQPRRAPTIDLTADTNMDADPSILPPIDGVPQQRPSTIDLTAGESDAPPTPGRSSRQQRQQEPAEPVRPGREDWVTRRAAELVRMGRPLTYPDAATSPEVARARAEAEYDDPGGWQRNPNSVESMSPQVREAVRNQLEIEAAQRNARTRASVGGDQPFNASDFRLEREADAAAQEANSMRKWNEWVNETPDRMAAYAPEEYKLYDQGVRERISEEAQANLRRRNDPAVDDPSDINPDTGSPWTLGERARKEDLAKDKQWLQQIAPQQNKALVRQLEEMGIDSRQFGDWRSPGFEREAALDAKNRAMAGGDVGGRYGAVQRRAQLRNNPAEYLGRQDITDTQRRTLAFLMSGGKGATANDVAALNAKMLFEGIGQGINMQRGMRIGDLDLKDRALGMQMRQQQLQQAAAEAEKFYNKRRGWGGLLDAGAYDDLIAMLSAMGLTQAEAEGLARRYKRKGGGRADRTAPPEA